MILKIGIQRSATENLRRKVNSRRAFLETLRDGRRKYSIGMGVVRELESLLTINENGQRKSIKKFEAITKQLVHKAISGSLSAIRLLIELRRDARERAAEMNERSPYDPLRPGTYSARDLTDDQLAEIILRGERKRSARKGSKRRKARQSRVIDK